MPKQDISDADIAALIAFLDWVSNVDNQNWPPRPILVTGATFPSPELAAAAPPSAADAASGAPAAAPVAEGAPSPTAENPIALGERVFRGAVPACTACHSTSPGVNMAGPSLAGIVGRTTAMLSDGSYKGKATDVEAYIRESIAEPSAHLVTGDMYSANGQSFMPNTYGKDLTPAQITQLVAYLTSLK